MKGQGLPHPATGVETGRLERELAIVWPLLGRHITFHRRLVDLTDSVKAALLLSQTIYWTRHGRDIEANAGWFFKTSEQWEWETGLSVKEQFTARRVLRTQAILAEQCIGLPAKLHYRLCVDRLGELVAERIGRAFVRLDLATDAELAELLGPPHSYHRKLAAVGGGVHAGLLLSRTMYLTRLHVHRPEAGWITRPIEWWTRELGLTRREQETARRELQQAGVWEETVFGVPRSLYVRVRLDELLNLLRESGGDPQTVAPIQVAVLPQAVMAVSANQGCGNPTFLFRRKRLNRFAESALCNIRSSTQGLLQPPRAGSDVLAAPCGGGDLVFPNGLLPEECAGALTLVGRVPERAQALLDELAGRMEASAVQTSPLSYLRGLVRRAEAGDFDPELGLRVAAARRQREAEALLRQERQAEELRQAAERASPEAQERVAERREEIRRLFGAGRTRPIEGSRP
jgi:hypothetical protein